jgi:hypothetical protein
MVMIGVEQAPDTAVIDPETRYDPLNAESSCTDAKRIESAREAEKLPEARAAHIF